jgi:antitoxin (DNA-binding transcriptional repressor) of toxin-antitoxin stability system
MKVLEINAATSSLEEYARNINKESIIVTKKGKPLAALVALKDSDMETIGLSSNPRFMELIVHSRTRYKAEGGISAANVRRSLKKIRTKRTQDDKTPGIGTD